MSYDLIGLLGISLALLYILVGKNRSEIGSLKHDVMVLSNITGRNDIYKKIVFEPRQSSEETQEA